MDGHTIVGHPTIFLVPLPRLTRKADHVRHVSGRMDDLGLIVSIRYPPTNRVAGPVRNTRSYLQFFRPGPTRSSRLPDVTAVSQAVDGSSSLHMI